MYGIECVCGCCVRLLIWLSFFDVIRVKSWDMYKKQVRKGVVFPVIVFVCGVCCCLCCDACEVRGVAVNGQRCMLSR